jgi:hypothetical protein
MNFARFVILSISAFGIRPCSAIRMAEIPALNAAFDSSLSLFGVDMA